VVDARSQDAQLVDAARHHVERTAMPGVRQRHSFSDE